jgi:dipeptidyl aminopeptidase/acylaminoacyl peptidase
MEYIYPRISPDGTRVALDVAGKNRDIWVGNLATGVVTKITDGPTEDLMPAWSPDGSRVFYASDREGGVFKVFSVAADGAGAERKEFSGTSNLMPLSMPAPDRLIAFASGAGTRNGDIAIVPLGEANPTPTVLSIERQQGSAQVSPDGRWIMYQSAESGTDEVYIRSYPDVERRREQVSNGGGIQPLWGRAGSNELFYWDLKGALKVVPVMTGDALRLGPPRDVPLADGVERPLGGAWIYAVSPVDGRLLMFKPVVASSAPVPFKVVVNWFEELKRLVPTN